MDNLQILNLNSIRKLGLGMIIGLSLSFPMSNALAKGGPQGGPPPEAFTACENLSEGDVCSVSTPRGEIEGSCKSPRKGEGALACAPERGRGRPRIN